MGPGDGSVPGLYLLAAYDIIDLLHSYTDLKLNLSFYEIYCGKLQDLLNKKSEVTCREDKNGQVTLTNIKEIECTDVEKIM
jgi:kinesin family protein 2/24